MKRNNKTAFIKPLFVLVAMMLALASCTPTDDTNVLFNGDEYQHMMDYISKDADLSSFVSIVKVAGMTDILSSYNHNNPSNDYTLFIPDNEGVNKFLTLNDYESFDALLSDTLYCQAIIRYHVVNATILSNEFPNGALSDKTISEDNLTIVYREVNDTTINYAVNGEAKVTTADILKSNGVIHVVDRMMTPITQTSYGWVEDNEDYTIFAELLLKTGLEDTMIATSPDDQGRDIYNTYTLFVESDALYANNGISSFDELVAMIDPEDNNYLDPKNAVNLYARYHILESNLFLDEIESTLTTKIKANNDKDPEDRLSRVNVIYNTYGDKPMSVDLNYIDHLDLSILQFNLGTEVFDSVYYDSTYVMIDFLVANPEQSNIVTRSGAVHNLSQLLMPFLPGRGSKNFQFYEEPEILAVKNDESVNVTILDADLDYIDLAGAIGLKYIKSSSDIEGCLNNDYLYYEGTNVEFTYETPRMLGGRYTLKLQLKRGGRDYASIQCNVDGKQIGVPVNPTQDASKFVTFVVGNVDFDGFESHTIELTNVETLGRGRVYLDRIIFTPIQ